MVLRWLNGDARLLQPVLERVQAPEAEVFVSQASLWEMAIKLSIGRLQVDLPELERQVPLQGFRDHAGVRGGPGGRPCFPLPDLLTQGRWLSLKLKTFLD
jgi:hypothetical protein